MHTATGIAVFARIVEKIETDIGVNLFPVAFPSFAFSLPSFLSSISAGRVCLRVGSFGDVDNKWVAARAPPPRWFALVHQIAVPGGERICSRITTLDRVRHLNFGE